MAELRFREIPDLEISLLATNSITVLCECACMHTHVCACMCMHVHMCVGCLCGHISVCLPMSVSACEKPCVFFPEEVSYCVYILHIVFF